MLLRFTRNRHCNQQIFRSVQFMGHFSRILYTTDVCVYQSTSNQTVSHGRNTWKRPEPKQHLLEPSNRSAWLSVLASVNWGISDVKILISKHPHVPAFQRPPHGFQLGMKLEAVDKRNPMLIRVTTISDTEDHRVKVYTVHHPLHHMLQILHSLKCLQ